MKKYIYYVLVILCTAGFNACSSDDDDYLESGQSIQITKSEVLFQAAASTGVVEFAAIGTVTATTDRDWCTASVSGNSVNVSVTENGSLEGRTSLLTLKCGADSINVTVQQTGLVFQVSAGSSIITDSDSEHTVAYGLNANVSLTFESDADWFSAVADGDSLRVSFKENTAGHLRKGMLTYKSATFTGSIDLIQYEFEKDIAGPCYLYYLNRNGQTAAMNAVLSETGLELPDFGWFMPLTFDKTQMKLIMPNGSYLGDYQNYYIYNIVEGGGFVFFANSVTMDMPILYDEESGLTYMDFLDNGTCTYEVECLHFYAFNSHTLSGNSMVGSLVALYYPSIYRFDPE